jgi:short-subunit dehydrogenase
MYGTSIAVSRMIKQGHGAVYNMEGLGSNRMIIKDNVLYGTSKAALTYFTAGAVKEAKGSPVIIGFLSPGMVVTDFLKSSKPEGHPKSAIRIFNLLADKVETVTPFLVDGMLKNRKHGRRIAWLTTGKMIRRFMFGWITGRKVMEL